MTPKLQTSDWREKMLSERDSGAYLEGDEEVLGCESEGEYEKRNNLGLGELGVSCERSVPAPGSEFPSLPVGWGSLPTYGRFGRGPRGAVTLGGRAQYGGAERVGEEVVAREGPGLREGRGRGGTGTVGRRGRPGQ